MEKQTPTDGRKGFPPLFWLVIVFEFFERGSYYGMMSVLSVYFTDVLHFSKQDVGVVKSVIQPILYFLPIVAGALADRFGYRRALTVAFALLGAGYFLTSRFTEYTAVFLSLVVMALGAGTFKPIISGTIARTTDESNSTFGFGIYYWSINLGAFIFPLVLVPYLKNNFGWSYVMLASAIGTGAMLIPTLLFFREPAVDQEKACGPRKNLLRTVADAFEIIYSPFVLVYGFALRSAVNAAVVVTPVLALLAYALKLYLYAGAASSRPFFLLFVAAMCATSFLILHVEKRVKVLPSGERGMLVLAFAGAMMALVWLIPGLTVFTRTLSSVIYLTLLSLFIIDLSETSRFRDHFKFLLMIFLYSGFWVLYFQMFDSVLWYVKAYVDASSLDRFVNGVLGAAGFKSAWKFDVEHVTVINAGTIICLQLVVSRIVKNTAALPTMIAGILMGTAGMAVLAISTDIWVFIVGTIIFSIGEMTAHPKFISYVGQTAPRERLALYMGYIFLYGVIGSSIGGILGANLYVHYVDKLHLPRTLWLIFAGIGVVTVAGLLLYNHFFGKAREETAGE
jgi:dipeptide/tripeptide permease